MRPSAAVAGFRALVGPAALAAVPALAACSAAPLPHDRAVPSSPGEATAEDARVRPAHRWDVPPPGRVLMVGNSFTFWNGGLWKPLAAECRNPGGKPQAPYPNAGQLEGPLPMPGVGQICKREREPSQKGLSS